MAVFDRPASPRIGLNAAAKAIGMPKHRLECLIKKGLVRPSRGIPERHEYFTQHDIEAVRYTFAQYR